jgi:hypothetical protein
MNTLSNNTELYQYLVVLAERLAQRGAQPLSDAVRRAAGHASGLSTEFLGESRTALRRVLAEEDGALPPVERYELRSVLSQIEAAFRRCSSEDASS